MNSGDTKDFEEIIKTTSSDELEAVCKLLTAGRMVKTFGLDGSTMSVEAKGTVYSDERHIAAIKNVYRNILIVVSGPVMQTVSGDQVVYTINNKGRNFLEYCQNRTRA